jgi:glycolate oxidase
VTERFNPLDAADLAALAGIVGGGQVLTGAEDLEKYARDEMVRQLPYRAEAVVRPGSPEEVARVLQLASSRRLPVTPRGAGTGLAGGVVPRFGGIVLSLERLDRIREIDADNFSAISEAGVTLKDFCEAVEARGLFFPLYPGERSATLGGNVATNAGGMRAVRHGVTRHHLLGLEVVLAGGEIVRTGGAFVKSSTGYDLTQLMAGSEGTLAVITAVTLRLALPPGVQEALWIPFTRLEDAIGAVPDILRSGVLPDGIEFMERDIIDLVEHYLGREAPLRGHAAYLLVLVEGPDHEATTGLAQTVSEVCRRHGAVDTYLPGSAHARRSLLELREKFYPAVRGLAPVDIADVVVPRSRIAEFVGQARQIAARHHIPVIIYGHAGDGNVHLHPHGEGMPHAEWEKRIPDLFKDLYLAGLALGGTISGEHGLGYDKKGYLPLAATPAALALMRGIKRAFDPLGILNPGKIFD